MTPQRVFVALGSNQAQPQKQVVDALAALDGLPSARLVAASRLWRSAPWGDPDQPQYINAVAELASESGPESLLAALQNVEQQLGRQRSERRWGPRTIDLDLLAVSGERRDQPALRLPHPRLHERRFVLAPWAEIAPGFEPPGMASVAQLLVECDDPGAAEPVAELQVAGPLQTLRSRLLEYRQAGQSVALVPTMGNLHAGHLSLVARARELAQRVVVSIFVNPTQFGPGEDFESYPRTLGADLMALLESGCDLAWVPREQDIYPRGLQGLTTVTVPVPAAGELCDAGRPGHFDGVASVVARLLSAVGPDVAVFGQKDFQQLKLIERMAQDLLLPVTIAAAPIVRESSGLAMSSRNSYLSAGQRERAAGLFATLSWAARQLADRDNRLAAVRTQALQRLEAAGLAPEYLVIRRADDLGEASEDSANLVVAAAVRVGTTRLIDNVQIMR